MLLRMRVGDSVSYAADPLISGQYEWFSSGYKSNPAKKPVKVLVTYPSKEVQVGSASLIFPARPEPQILVEWLMIGAACLRRDCLHFPATQISNGPACGLQYNAFDAVTFLDAQSGNWFIALT